MEDNYNQKYGVVYEGVKLEDRMGTVSRPFAFLTRRVTIIGLIYFLREH